MNKSQIHEFLVGPIENVVHLDFKHAKRVPELVEEAVEDVEALEDVENLDEILASKNWSFIPNDQLLNEVKKLLSKANLNTNSFKQFMLHDALYFEELDD